jgi:hypothetical protein
MVRARRAVVLSRDHPPASRPRSVRQIQLVLSAALARGVKSTMISRKVADLAADASSELDTRGLRLRSPAISFPFAQVLAPPAPC